MAKRAWRDGPWYWVTVALVVAAIAALVSYEIWMRQSLSKLTDREIDEFGVASFFCSDEHFWGQSINFRYHSDNIRRNGLLCRDWAGQKWIPSRK